MSSTKKERLFLLDGTALAHEIEERYRREVQVCAALEQAGVPAGEIVHVGDDPDHDVRGARALSITADAGLVITRSTPPSA